MGLAVQRPGQCRQLGPHPAPLPSRPSPRESTPTARADVPTYDVADPPLPGQVAIRLAWRDLPRYVAMFFRRCVAVAECVTRPGRARAARAAVFRLVSTVGAFVGEAGVDARTVEVYPLTQLRSVQALIASCHARRRAPQSRSTPADQHLLPTSTIPTDGNVENRVSLNSGPPSGGWGAPPTLPRLINQCRLRRFHQLPVSAARVATESGGAEQLGDSDWAQSTGAQSVHDLGEGRCGERGGVAAGDVQDWTYQVMAQEMVLEGKIESPSNPATPAVGDQRTYLYIEVGKNTGRATRPSGLTPGLSVGVQLKAARPFTAPTTPPHCGRLIEMGLSRQPWNCPPARHPPTSTRSS